MIKKYINALKIQIEKLDQEKFELESWKSATIILLDRIFGANNLKIQEISKITDDKSSWTLRDTKGLEGINSCKDKGKQILEASILEIELLGIEEKRDYLNPEIIINIFKDKLNNSQFIELQKIMKSQKEEHLKYKIIIDFLKNINILPELLAEIINQANIVNEF